MARWTSAAGGAPPEATAPPTAARMRSAPASTVAPRRFAKRRSVAIDKLLIYPTGVAGQDELRRAASAPWRVVSAGVGAVAVGYGLARYGYGLFLPDLRAEFGLSSAALGLIASTAYASYLLAVISAGGPAPRPRPPPPGGCGGGG